MIKVTTHPFGLFSDQQKRMLEEYGQVEYNETGRRLTEADLLPFIGNASAIVAGTEKYSKEVLAECPNLKVISRVGVGFDNVDLDYCRERGIIVAYTPEAPADSVAEMTVAQMISMIRRLPDSGLDIAEGRWKRIIGRQLSEMNVGILGVGRIGFRVSRLLSSFGCMVVGCDTNYKIRARYGRYITGGWRDKLFLFEDCDIVTVHVPMNEDNYHLVGQEEIDLLGEGYLINNSRGGVVDETAVVNGLCMNLLGYAADVFETEPYKGPLSAMGGAYLTAHMGSSTRKARDAMELGAARNCVAALTGKHYEEVPYDVS